MFDNIGEKIKMLAKISCWIGIICCFIFALNLFAISNGDEILITIGFVIMILGPFLSWIGSFALYGFGELINNSTIIAQQSNQSNQCDSKKIEDEYKKEKEQQKIIIKAQISDKNVYEENYIDIQCPNCDSEISYTKQDFLNNEFFVCPYCDEQFKTSIFKK